jgi:transposase
MIRYIGLDVHKRVVEACVLDEAGKIVFRNRFALSRESLAAFASVRLLATDRVVLEATTNTWAVVRILKPHVAEVIVSNPLQTKAIAQGKVKTDKVDAYVLAQLLRCDFLPRVWEPDEATQEMRRWTSRRASLVADRTTVKNRLHSVLAQRLIVPPVADLFPATTFGSIQLTCSEVTARGAIGMVQLAEERIHQVIPVEPISVLVRSHAPAV